MTEAVGELLDKSLQSICAAELLLKEGYFSFAATALSTARIWRFR
jgi:hypothetical protein